MLLSFDANAFLCRRQNPVARFCLVVGALPPAPIVVKLVLVLLGGGRGDGLVLGDCVG